MVETVVVPTDGSEFSAGAVPIGQAVAGSFDAGLVIVLAGHGGNPENDQRIVARLEDAIATRPDLRARVEVDRGRFAANAITRVLRDTSDPVACMATRGRSGIGQMLLGSVAEDVVRISGVPIVLVGPECASTWDAGGRPIVMCHDGSAVADEIGPPVTAWASELNLPVVVVEVQDDDSRELTPSSAVVSAAERMRETVGTVDVEVLSGDAPEAILAFAAERSAALVALSTHGRTGLDRVTIGSVAVSIVRSSPCPVLVQRPRDLAR
jgi:nucleotide-binding universal stress UspA family protein